MIQIEVQLGQRSYPITIGPGLLNDSALLADAVPAKQLLVISNETVAPLYLERVERAFGSRQLQSLVLPDGEQFKTIETFNRVIDTLIAGSFHRDACIIALGGGVIGDLAGFAAACYQRGIDFLQLPTTLLAQVDSSVGGKTAVNHPNAKNMIGAFHQPIAVIADTDTLTTLPQRELAAGMAEVIKYGLIEDAGFFAWLEANMDGLLQLDGERLSQAIARCCELKAQVVAEDEQERGRRALLNLGHTFGHAIEALAGYGSLLHGEAVAIGMLMAADASVSLGRMSAADTARIESLLERAGLPVAVADLGVDAIFDRMQLDKKAGATGLKLILLNRIGEAVVEAAPADDIVRQAIAGRISSTA